LVFADGPWATALPRIDVTRATLAPRGGAPGDLKVADVDVPTPDGHTAGDYLPEGAQLIPVLPLVANTVYDAHVELTAQGVALRKSWSFTTGPATTPALGRPAPATVVTKFARPKLTIARPSYTNGLLRFVVSANPTLVGRAATLRIAVPGRKTKRSTVTLAKQLTVSVKATRATLSVSVAPFSAGSVHYGTITASRTGSKPKKP
jgi:hypothetical protein